MGSSAHAMIGVFVDLPAIPFKINVPLHGCTNENCHNHKTKAPLKKTAEKCGCGHPAGTIYREANGEIDANQFVTHEDDLRANFESNVLYDEKFVKHLSIHYQDDMKMIDLEKAATNILEFKSKHESLLEKIKNKYSIEDVPVKYGVFS